MVALYAFADPPSSTASEYMFLCGCFVPETGAYTQLLVKPVHARLGNHRRFGFQI